MARRWLVRLVSKWRGKAAVRQDGSRWLLRFLQPSQFEECPWWLCGLARKPYADQKRQAVPCGKVLNDLGPALPVSCNGPEITFLLLKFAESGQNDYIFSHSKGVLRREAHEVLGPHAVSCRRFGDR